jgi:hypothetical protein
MIIGKYPFLFYIVQVYDILITRKIAILDVRPTATLTIIV